MREPDRLEYAATGESYVKALAERLDVEVGPRWDAWHVGDAVPGAAMLARFTTDQFGREVLSGVLLLAPDGAAITADQLRKVPVAALENSANLSRETADERRQAELSQLAPLVRDQLDGEAFSRLVAEHFKVWAQYVPHPAAAMAAEWDVKAPTMHTWIREARLRGFLPAARRGKG